MVHHMFHVSKERRKKYHFKYTYIFFPKLLDSKFNHSVSCYCILQFLNCGFFLVTIIKCIRLLTVTCSSMKNVFQPLSSSWWSLQHLTVSYSKVWRLLELPQYFTGNLAKFAYGHIIPTMEQFNSFTWLMTSSFWHQLIGGHDPVLEIW